MPDSNRSITFTALIWLGILLAIAGALIAVLGVGGAVTFDIKYNDMEFHSTNLGLAILVVVRC